MRKVKALSTQSNEIKELMTSATTWGQLKEELGSLIQGDMKATVQSTKQTLEHNEAVLPDGDFVLFITPNKVKSGLNKLKSIFTKWLRK